MAHTTLVWFRNDLRLSDHPALSDAAKRGAVLPVFVWDPAAEGDWAPGGAARVWLRESLRALTRDLKELGAGLVIRRGASADVLAALARAGRADRVVWNRRVEPAAVDCEQAVTKSLIAQGVETESFNGGLLFPPGAVMNRGGYPYRVFTPFHKQCGSLGDPESPLPRPKRLIAPPVWPQSEAIEGLELHPGLAWADRLLDGWRPGEAGARQRLAACLGDVAGRYDRDRDFPAADGTSRLSPHLHFGELSVRALRHALKAAGGGAGLEALRRQLAWREFAHHMLWHFPRTPREPFRPEFRAFPWSGDAGLLAAWQRGMTGYPIVDAGMRELWRTGWMHNRVRMIAASFLTKDLRLSWLEGARWFWDTLVDADLANNTFGWQWAAGCGADAAPYFRVFNPVLQGRKFDAEGRYVRRWVPELAALPDRWLHRPWEAPRSVLDRHGVALGQTYPRPVVNHARARTGALRAYDGIMTRKRDGKRR